MSNFEKASRIRLRFPIGGNVTVEQVWNTDEESLIAYEEVLQDELDKLGKSSRRKPVAKSNEIKRQELRLSIVSHVLDTKSAEKIKESSEAETKRHNERILNLIADKKDKEFEALSITELEAQLK